MARLIGERPENIAEARLYDYIVKELPDYIYAIYLPANTDGLEKISECDFLVFIPHLGVLLLDVCGFMGLRVENGIPYFVSKNGQTRPWRKIGKSGDRYLVRNHLRNKFYISPFVYQVQCFPNFTEDKRIRDQLKDITGAEYIMFAEDLQSDLDFLMNMMWRKREIERNGIGNEMFDDLTDEMARNVYLYWDTGMTPPGRPGKPPLVFLSYNQKNQLYAKEIKEELEKKKIFVWRAPEDVGIGNDYKPDETKAIHDCDVFLILLSASAQESEEVRYEFEEAVKCGKKILPIWVDDCKINEYYEKALAKYQYRFMPRFDIGIMAEIIGVIKGTTEQEI